MRGDSAVISVASKKIVLTGNVELRRPGLLIAGESIQATDSNTIVINKANILYHKAHALASGSKFTYKPNIGKRGHLHIKDAKITTCEPGDNGWEFQASSLLLNFNIDYAFMNHPRLKVEDVPVGYLPWAFFNLNQDRQWGILEPVFGSSSRGGSDITLPLYIPFNSYSDITISPQKISNRGDGLEAQFRILSKYSYSEVNTSYYENDLVYAKLKNLAENSDSKRYLLNLVHKMNLDLSEDIKFIADVNYFDVSDSHIFNDLLFATYDTGIVNGSSNIKSSAKALLQSPIGNFEYGFKRYLPTLGLLESTNYYKNYWQFAGSQNLSNSLQIDYSNHRANIVDSESNIFNRNNATVNLLHTAYTRLLDITTTVGSANLAIDDNAADSNYFNIDIAKNLYSKNKLHTKFKMYYANFDTSNQSHLPDLEPVSNFILDYDFLFTDIEVSSYGKLADYEKLAIGVSINSQSRVNAKKHWRFAIGTQNYIKHSQVLIADSKAAENKRQHWLAQLYLPTTKHSDLITKISYNQNQDLEYSAAYIYHFDTVINRQQIIEVSFFDYKHRGQQQQQLNTALYSKLSNNFGIFFNYQQSLLDARNLSQVFGLRYEGCCFQVDLLQYSWEQNLENSGVNNLRDTGILLQFSLKGVFSLGTGISEQVQNYFSLVNPKIDSSFND